MNFRAHEQGTAAPLNHPDVNISQNRSIYLSICNERRRVFKTSLFFLESGLVLQVCYEEKKDFSVFYLCSMAAGLAPDVVEHLVSSAEAQWK